MFTRQLLYVGSNYICTLSLLTEARGSEVFFAISAMFIANGWIGSFFINRISAAEGRQLSRKDYIALALFLVGYSIYLLRLVPLEVSLYLAFALLVRGTHDFFRKRLFLLGDASEWLPFVLKVSFVAVFLFDLPTTVAIAIYVFIYGCCLANYWFQTPGGGPAAAAPLNLNPPKYGDLFVGLRVSYRNLALLYLPFAYPTSATVEAFLYWWALLSVLAVFNDMIERYALRRAVAIPTWMIWLVTAATLMIIALAFGLAPERLLVIVLVVARQGVLGLENYAYILERLKGSLTRMYIVELVKIGGTMLLFSASFELSISVLHLLTLLLLWEISVGLMLASLLTYTRSA